MYTILSRATAHTIYPLPPTTLMISNNYDYDSVKGLEKVTLAKTVFEHLFLIDIYSLSLQMKHLPLKSAFSVLSYLQDPPTSSLLEFFNHQICVIYMHIKEV